MAFLPFELRQPPMNTVHVGSPRCEPLSLCLIGLRMNLLCEHTHIVRRGYKKAEVLMYHVFLYPNHTEVSMQQKESP